MSEVTAIVFAGGYGTRLRSVISDLPKPMANVIDRPFLAHLMNYWKKQGVGRFVLSVGYLHRKISSYFGDSFDGCPLEYVVEHTPLGTGGALLRCVSELSIDEAFLLLNGDTYFEVGLSGLRQAATKNEADWLLSLFQTDDVDRFLPVNFASNGRVSFLEEASRRSYSPVRGKIWANGGVYWVNPRSLTSLEMPTSCSLERDILPRCVDQNQRIFGFPSTGVFIDIGLPEDFARAQSMRVFGYGSHQ